MHNFLHPPVQPDHVCHTCNTHRMKIPTEIMNPHVARYEREGHLRHRHGKLVTNVAHLDTLAILGDHGIKSKVEKNPE